MVLCVSAGVCVSVCTPACVCPSCLRVKAVPLRPGHARASWPSPAVPVISSPVSSPLALWCKCWAEHGSPGVWTLERELETAAGDCQESGQPGADRRPGSGTAVTLLCTVGPQVDLRQNPDAGLHPQKSCFNWSGVRPGHLEVKSPLPAPLPPGPGIHIHVLPGLRTAIWSISLTSDGSVLL